MIPKVSKVKHVDGYTLWLQFTDGQAGVIDLTTELWGPVFEPLKELGLFRQVAVDSELETISWPNGADFAPEYLYQNIRPQETAAVESR